MQRCLDRKADRFDFKIKRCDRKKPSAKNGAKRIFHEKVTVDHFRIAKKYNGVCRDDRYCLQRVLLNTDELSTNAA